MSKDPKKVSHRDKFLCANCLYSGKCTYAAPRTCPSCQASDCCETVWYRLRFPSKNASKTRWKEVLTAMGWMSRIEEKTEYGTWIAKVVRKVCDR